MVLFMTKKLLQWLNKEESSIIKTKVDKMLNAILGTSEEFNTAIGFCEEDSLMNASSAIKRLEQKENLADQLQIELISLMKKTNFDPNTNSDLLDMMRTFDKISNNIKCAARNLSIILELSISIPKIIVENYSAMSSKLVEMNASLLLLFRMLLSYDNPEMFTNEKFEAELGRINQGENEIDDLYYETKKLLSTTDRNVGTIFLFRDLLEAIERSADVCNDITYYGRFMIR